MLVCIKFWGSETVPPCYRYLLDIYAIIKVVLGQSEIHQIMSKTDLLFIVHDTCLKRIQKKRSWMNLEGKYYDDQNTQKVVKRMT